MDNKEVIVHSSRGHILQIGKKFYKLDREDKDEEGRTVKRQIFKEIDKDSYITDLKSLASKIRKEYPLLGLAEVIFDSLKNLPLERVSKIKDALLKVQKESRKKQEHDKKRREKASEVEERVGWLLLGE